MPDDPALLQRLISQLQAKNYDAEAAREIALAGLQKAGNLDAQGQLTAKGHKRELLGAGGRARDRAASRSNGRHAPYEYEYSPRTNRATLVK